MIPMIIFVWFGLLRDNLRFGCIPVIIATGIFQFLIFTLAMIVVVNCIICANNWIVRGAHIANIVVLVFSIIIASLYRNYYAKRDLLRTEEEEI